MIKLNLTKLQLDCALEDESITEEIFELILMTKKISQSYNKTLKFCVTQEILWYF